MSFGLIDEQHRKTQYKERAKTFTPSWNYRMPIEVGGTSTGSKRRCFFLEGVEANSIEMDLVI